MPLTTTDVKMLRGLGDTEYIHANLQRHRFPLHFHETFVIELVHSGEDWCSDAKVIAGHDEVYVHFPFAAHTGGTIGAKQLIYSAIYPSIELFSKMTGIPSNEVPTGVSLVLDDRELVKEMHKLLGIVATLSEREAKAERSLKHVFSRILDQHAKSAADRTDVSMRAPIHQKMLIARDYLVSNFVCDITTQQLSNHCDVSQFHLIRSFKRQFGITPRQFLISQRVAKAKQMIASGESITVAAHSTGFADQSHLTRHFKRITSYSPRQIKCKL